MREIASILLNFVSKRKVCIKKFMIFLYTKHPIKLFDQNFWICALIVKIGLYKTVALRAQIRVQESFLKATLQKSSCQTSILHGYSIMVLKSTMDSNRSSKIKKTFIYF